jgi:spore germination protein KC
MKRLNYVLITFLFIPFLFCGCTRDMNRKEIDQINLVLVLGIDYANGEYTLSALYNTGGGADPGEGSSGKGKEDVAKGTGKTAYEALEDLKRNNKKAISLAQTGSFLIGDGAAKKGLKESIDFLSRDETIKMESLLYITKDRSASDFINNAIDNKQTIHEDLEAIEQKQKELLTRNDNTFVNVLNDMEQTYSSVLVPYIVSEESGFLIEGYAVFNQLKLMDYLDEETSNGVNFMRNLIRNFPIYLDDRIGLLITNTKTKLKSNYNNKVISVIVRVNFETMIKEATARNNIFTQQGLVQLTDEQNDYIRKVIEKAINYSKATGCDIYHVARMVENQNVSDWEDIKKDWSNVIAKIDYQFDLKSKVTKSFILGNER